MVQHDIGLLWLLSENCTASHTLHHQRIALGFGARLKIHHWEAVLQLRPALTDGGVTYTW